MSPPRVAIVPLNLVYPFEVFSLVLLANNGAFQCQLSCALVHVKNILMWFNVQLFYEA